MRILIEFTYLCTDENEILAIHVPNGVVVVGAKGAFGSREPFLCI